MKKKHIIRIVLVIFFAELAIYSLNPFENIIEQRASNNVETIKVIYVNITGNDNCAKLYKVADSPKEAVFPAYPQVIESIEETKLAYSDNVFILKGYSYNWVTKNSLTGSKVTEKSPRFDVIEWQVITPYTIWTEKTDKDGMVLAEKSSEPKKYKIEKYEIETESNNAVFIKENTIDCMK